jgi:uncharacterized membrane protein YgdD (TMEM256/DUF423 family)
MYRQKQFLAFSGFSGAIAVALGALGAHFLKSKLEAGFITEINLHTFDTAVKYQIYHAIALLAVSLLADKFKDKLFLKAGYCFMIGTVLFSGSLYLLSLAGIFGLTNIHWLGPITPVGGLFFIAGWILLGCAALKRNTIT